ncbi:hypothetical protein [Ammoniphilus sp. CFH 90114]|uniref:hypothetical protein n=1 Tax=Ammoniphilus sp. CFH 90114 TaxID=2493665 RepID=UPI0013E96DCE|nr:hypothetical protein [Ammoniphilus sp. CFH 90114]
MVQTLIKKCLNRDCPDYLEEMIVTINPEISTASLYCETCLVGKIELSSPEV